ncbi:hypothetical protein CDAR_220381 [Caerostris darwini]|uniref:Uncharacterized protein n=1 Tax=Caerostris darwini TaxID=1538125 RepID=A0AAV4UFH5_9ARAC|nr:hypothetical protein CDAR_220381 [Caerostris darwini]
MKMFTKIGSLLRKGQPTIREQIVEVLIIKTSERSIVIVARFYEIRTHAEIKHLIPSIAKSTTPLSS